MPQSDRELLERVLAQTTKTNGRVDQLEVAAAATKRVLYGDPHDPTDHGLVGISKDVARVVASHDRVVRVVTWASTALVTSLVFAAVAWATT